MLYYSIIGLYIAIYAVMIALDLFRKSPDEAQPKTEEVEVDISEEAKMFKPIEVSKDIPELQTAATAAEKKEKPEGKLATPQKKEQTKKADKPKEGKQPLSERKPTPAVSPQQPLPKTGQPKEEKNEPELPKAESQKPVPPMAENKEPEQSMVIHITSEQLEADPPVEEAPAPAPDDEPRAQSASQPEPTPPSEPKAVPGQEPEPSADIPDAEQQPEESEMLRKLEELKKTKYTDGILLELLLDNVEELSETHPSMENAEKNISLIQSDL